MSKGSARESLEIRRRWIYKLLILLDWSCVDWSGDNVCVNRLVSDVIPSLSRRIQDSNERALIIHGARGESARTRRRRGHGGAEERGGVLASSASTHSTSPPPGAISTTQPLPDAKRRPARDTSASACSRRVHESCGLMLRRRSMCP